ncbi:hypothetical protein AVEN_203724-1 [Araneus ventricosus]|uniref:Uncharacterized protein n=1 Tax=Araneus ventricosus TaxID=182803 RepID=A0A4Y2ITG4_ARAVE|nr:hypothetical protein AVEN_203724-1 [Araneus ventricosus]
MTRTIPELATTSPDFLATATAELSGTSEKLNICHRVYLYSVLAYEEASAKLRTRMAEKSRQNLVSRQKIRGIIKFMSENRDLFRPP